MARVFDRDEVPELKEFFVNVKFYRKFEPHFRWAATGYRESNLEENGPNHNFHSYIVDTLFPRFQQPENK